MAQVSPFTAFYFDMVREIYEEESEDGCPKELVKQFPEMAEPIKFAALVVKTINEMSVSSQPSNNVIAQATLKAFKENPSYKNTMLFSIVREIEACLDT
jgi:hypothetical protein